MADHYHNMMKACYRNHEVNFGRFFQIVLNFKEGLTRTLVRMEDIIELSKKMNNNKISSDITHCDLVLN
jgi:hypothetical protein